MADYPNNTETQGVTSTSSCCRRNCMPDSKCGLGEEGCLTNEDCDTGRTTAIYPASNCFYATGLQCDRNADRPSCIDIDECTGIRLFSQSLVVLFLLVRPERLGQRSSLLWGRLYLHQHGRRRNHYSFDVVFRPGPSPARAMKASRAGRQTSAVRISTSACSLKG